MELLEPFLVIESIRGQKWPRVIDQHTVHHNSIEKLSLFIAADLVCFSLITAVAVAARATPSHLSHRLPL